MKTGVYQILNLVNGKRYIGSTAVSFMKRWGSHKKELRNNYHHSKSLQRAWNKYGQENFSFEVLATCPKEYCIKLEQWFLDNFSREYNVCPTAGSRLGTKVSEEERKKMSERGKKRAEDPLERKRMSEMQLKRFQDPEQRAINKRIAVERYAKEEERLKNRERLKKHYAIPANRERLRQQAIKQWENAELKNKILEGRKKWLSTPESRELISKNSKKTFETQESRDKMSETKAKFVYKIKTPNGEIEETRSLKRYCKEKKLSDTALGYSFRGYNNVGVTVTQHKGYKLLSKTPIK